MKASQRPVSSTNPAFSQYRLFVHRSGIHGSGVFAAERIPRGRKVIEYTGQRISKRAFLKRARRMSQAHRRRFAYLAQVDRYWLVDGAIGGSGAELANHSCEPNLLQRRLHGHILLFSRRTIQKGEELTWDYHFPKNGEIVPCHCGSPKCRGTINVR
jgi:SET domain-containing protein